MTVVSETFAAASSTPVVCREGQLLDIPERHAARYAAKMRESGKFSAAYVNGRVFISADWGVGIQYLDPDNSPLELSEYPTETLPRRLVLIFPKGVKDADDGERWKSLARFAQLVALSEGADVSDVRSDETWDSSCESQGEKFLLILAAPLLTHTTTILLRHQRRHYRTEDETLIGRVRGRLLVGPHVRNSIGGRGHHMPCRYEEFDFDNADNRVLKSALRRLTRVARTIAPGGWLANKLHTQAERFTGVSDTERPKEDLRRTRFDRISSAYRTALAWARMVHQGLGDATSGDESGFWLDSAKVFEKFVERVAQASMPSHQVAVQSCNKGVFVGRARPETRPDIVIGGSGDQSPLAIGDAKYKDVCQACEAENGSETPNLTQAIGARMSSADTYQLFAYMRLRKCPIGFYVVPYWDPKGKAAAADTEFTFAESPLDHDPEPRDARVFAIGLNMSFDPVDVLQVAADLLLDELTPIY